MTALPHDLCACGTCGEAARRILLDVPATRRTMTEPERRRAAGESAFCEHPADVKISRAFLRDVAHGTWDLKHASPTLYACSMVAALLRALVLQELLITFSPPWTTPEVTP